MRKKIKKFYCIGDSITNGARNEFYRDYVLELNYLFKDKSIVILNSSVNGETTSEILEPAIKTVTSPEREFAAVIVFKVEPFKLTLSCSAITNILIESPLLHFLIYLLIHQRFQL